MHNKDCHKEKSSSIGGQAVIEGVMMKSASSMATAVRCQDGEIRTETKRLSHKKSLKILFKIPIIRGVVSFIQSLIVGMKVLLRSAEVYGDSEPTKVEKWLANKLKVNVMGIVTATSMLLGIALAIFLFIWLPQFFRERIEIWFGITLGIWPKNFIEGGLKLLIFLSYILLCTLIKDVKRTFMYHGAEHKTITCYESGLDLTVENAKKCSRIHDRCGTTFLIFVMIISILTAALAESLIGESVEKLWRVLLKISLLPVVAGFSYELLKGLAKTKCFIFMPLKFPGILLQHITTKEPDDKMIEVAIIAFNLVMDMDKDQTILEKQFVVGKKRIEVLNDVKNTLTQYGIVEKAESEWVVSIILDINRDEVESNDYILPSQIDKINKIVNQRVSGRPLWYCLGDTEFYGYKIKVDERVLIPRPETELLVYNALSMIDDKTRVLDLCTGSGAIAITVNKETGASVIATDKSKKALQLARENAKINNAEIEFIESDMFNALDGKKFDVIISNPPYIKSADILTLQKEVKDYEPRIALDGGKDGYDFYRIIANHAKDHLSNGGVLFLECGENQAETIKEMLTDFKTIEIIKDYENIDRIIKAVL